MFCTEIFTGFRTVADMRLQYVPKNSLSKRQKEANFGKKCLLAADLSLS